MENNNTPPAGWKLWILWTLANVLAFAIGITVSLVVYRAVGEIAASAALGIVVGVFQWLVLRNRLLQTRWWIMSNALGVPLGFAAVEALNHYAPGGWKIVLAGDLRFLALGLIVGFAQWIVLKRVLRKAGWWTLANVLGWSLGWYATYLIALVLPEFFAILVGYAVIGLIYGIITGLALILFIRKNIREETRDVNLPRSWAVTGIALALIVAATVWENLPREAAILGQTPDLGAPPTEVGLPPLECEGSEEYCSEVVFFEPVDGITYLNYPENGETDDDQYRSYLRRDLVILVQYATYRTVFETGDWTDEFAERLGLGDMSEADGSIPGTSIGSPGHPSGTHENGLDIDIAYFQVEPQNVSMKIDGSMVDIEANLLRPMCIHSLFGMEAYRCTEPPLLLDPWRTALFIAYLSEHPRLRVIGVDGQIGPLIDEALDQLVQAGYITSDLRDQIPLVYEVTDEGMGWFHHHHHHLHVSMMPDE